MKMTGQNYSLHFLRNGVKAFHEAARETVLRHRAEAEAKRGVWPVCVVNFEEAWQEALDNPSLSFAAAWKKVVEGEPLPRLQNDMWEKRISALLQRSQDTLSPSNGKGQRIGHKIPSLYRYLRHKGERDARELVAAKGRDVIGAMNLSLPVALRFEIGFAEAVLDGRLCLTRARKLLRDEKEMKDTASDYAKALEMQMRYSFAAQERAAQKIDLLKTAKYWCTAPFRALKALRPEAGRVEASAKCTKG